MAQITLCLFLECSKTLVGLSDTIESNGFPTKYPLGTDCLWRIKIPKGYKVVIKFDGFKLRSFDSTHECADYLDLLENGKETTFRGRYCGSHSPGEVRFASNDVTVHFHTTSREYESEAVGFSASYSAEGMFCHQDDARAIFSMSYLFGLTSQF